MIVVSTAHGLKFAEFKTQYHDEALGFPSAHPNRPIELGSEPTAVAAALHRLLDATPVR